ncbi:hypothetical protein [Parasphingorhabdus pacifica]
MLARAGRQGGGILRRAFAALASKVRGWVNRIVGTVAESVNALPGIGQALSAAVQGRSPLWEGLKGAVANLSRATKATLLVGGAITLLLGPVVLVLLLLAALIAWIVTALRPHQKSETTRPRTS